MIIAVGGWRGQGASVTSLLLAWCAALVDETGAWLIEADPAGGVLAGRLQLPTHSVGGLERVAFPQGHSVAEALVSVAHQPAGSAGRLHVVAAPVDPFRAHACHQPRAAWWSALRDLPGHVVIDVGSLRAGTPAQPLIDSADHVLVTTSPEVSAAVSASEMVGSGGRISATEHRFATDRARIVIVDSPSGISFPASTLQQQLGAQCVGVLPWDPAAVDLVHRGAGLGERRLKRSSLIAAAQRIATAVLGPNLPVTSAS